MLIIILAGILAFLWMLDAFFTVQVLKKKGDKKETNLLVRSVYRSGVFTFIAFKITIMIFVLAVLFLVSKGYPVTAESVAFVFIYIYAKVDWHNCKIWKNRNNKKREVQEPQVLKSAATSFCSSLPQTI